MKIAVVTDSILKEELLTTGLKEDIVVEWLDSPQVTDATVYVDLLFTPDAQRVKLWEKLQPELVIAGSMITTLDQLPAGFVRLNAWPTFLKRPVAEVACTDHALKEKTEIVFAAFNRKVEWVPDIPGFITARVVSMIINEAFFAFDEKVSSQDEIDTAMKLGTNYPYGPFEWSRLIGLKNIYALLDNLSGTHARYTAAPLLQKAAEAV